MPAHGYYCCFSTTIGKLHLSKLQSEQLGPNTSGCAATEPKGGQAVLQYFCHLVECLLHVLVWFCLGVQYMMWYTSTSVSTIQRCT